MCVEEGERRESREMRDRGFVAGLVCVWYMGEKGGEEKRIEREMGVLRWGGQTVWEREGVVAAAVWRYS